MVLGQRQRYIAYNVGLWLVICVGGVALLGVLRQYGFRVSTRQEARGQLAEAKSYCEQNAVAKCEERLHQALDLYPDICGEVIEELGERLVGLPSVRARLGAMLDQDPDRVDELTLARYRIVNGETKRAVAVLTDLVAGGDGGREAYLWLARAELASGDMPAAQRHFDEYWAMSADDRAEVVARIRAAGAADAEGLYKTGRKFFNSGLWKEAFSAFSEAGRLGLSTPDLEFFQGVALELAGRREQALDVYSKVLAELPSHLMTLRRLEALSPGLS